MQAAEAQPPLGWFSSRKLEFCQNEIFPTELFKYVNAGFPLENYSSGNSYPLLLHIQLCVSAHSAASDFIEAVFMFLAIFASGH